MAKRLKPTQVVAQSPLSRPAVVLAKVHIQHPVHRLDPPVASHRLRETLAAQIATAQIKTHLVRLTTIGHAA